MKKYFSLILSLIWLLTACSPASTPAPQESREPPVIEIARDAEHDQGDKKCDNVEGTGIQTRYFTRNDSTVIVINLPGNQKASEFFWVNLGTKNVWKQVRLQQGEYTIESELTVMENENLNVPIKIDGQLKFVDIATVTKSNKNIEFLCPATAQP